MSKADLKRLLMDIPIKLCRTMDHQFVKSILKDLEINFSQQHYTILNLLEEQEHLYLTEFVDILGITKSQMTALIDKLIKMGYVNRNNDINDRRKIYVSTTEEGKKITSQINTAINLKIDNHLSELSKKDSDVLENGLLILQELCKNCNNEK